MKSRIRNSDADTRTKLLAAAERIILESGLTGVSVRKVGDRAGVNPTLVTYHFGGIGELLEELCQLNIAVIVEGWAPIASFDGRAPDIASVMQAWISPLQLPAACTGDGRALVVLDEIAARDGAALKEMVVEEMGSMAFRVRDLLMPLCPHLDPDEVRARIRLIAAAALGPAPRNIPVPELSSGLPMDHISYLVRFACAALGEHGTVTSGEQSG